jgi:hypothetical protein
MRRSPPASITSSAAARSWDTDEKRGADYFAAKQ